MWIQKIEETFDLCCNVRRECERSRVHIPWSVPWPTPLVFFSTSSNAVRRASSSSGAFPVLTSWSDCKSAVRSSSGIPRAVYSSSSCSCSSNVPSANAETESDDDISYACAFEFLKSKFEWYERQQVQTPPPVMAWCAFTHGNHILSYVQLRAPQQCWQVQFDESSFWNFEQIECEETQWSLEKNLYWMND